MFLRYQQITRIIKALAPETIVEAVRALAADQPLFDATGACHAAALLSGDGRVLAAAEDVGRHNALDKAIGRAVLSGADMTRCVAVLSGRAGYDLVIKLLRVGCPVIISISAPSALAFDLCKTHGATLVGMARGARFKTYWDAGRIHSDP